MTDQSTARAARPTWAAAAAAAAALVERPPLIEQLHLLARLAPATADLLTAAAGYAAPTPVRLALAELRDRGLVHTVAIPRPTGAPVGVHALSDLGLATLGLLDGIDPATLAADGRCGGPQLATALARGEETLAIAAAMTMFLEVPKHRARDIVVGRPWCGRAETPAAGVRTLHFPAYVGAHFGGQYSDCVIVPDIAVRPPHTWLAEFEAYVEQFGRQHEQPDGMVPPPLLIVAAPGHRARDWEAVLGEVARRCGQDLAWIRAGIAALVSPAGHELVDGLETGDTWSPGWPTPGRRAHRGGGAQFPGTLAADPSPALLGPDIVPAVPIPALVDAPLLRAARHLPGLHLAAREWKLLELYASHAALSEGIAAVILRWRRRNVVEVRNRLVAAGLVRTIGAEEFAEESRPAGRAAVATHLTGERPAEATLAGLAALADRAGLSLTAAAERLGLAGGGPGVDAGGEPVCVGPRAGLVRQWHHTTMLYMMHGHLVEQAALANARRDPDDGRARDGVALWLPGAAVRHAALHPDAYVDYRRDGVAYPALLEVDYATAERRRYLGKLLAYQRHAPVVRARLGLAVPPTVLVMAGGDAHEELLAAVAREVLATGDPVPLLLTTASRVDASIRGGTGGMLGAVWRTPTDPVRRPWVSD